MFPYLFQYKKQLGLPSRGFIKKRPETDADALKLYDLEQKERKSATSGH